MKTNHSFAVLTGPADLASPSGTGQRRLALKHPASVVAALLAFCALLAAGPAVRASDPVGIYAFVDKVVFEPGESAPERLQVWGGFALAEGRGDKYAPAARGYLYFKLKPGEEDACRKEWADLKSVAGTGQIVAFGVRYNNKGTVRKADAKPDNPDAYPTGLGMTKVRRNSSYAPVADLLKLREARPAAKQP